MSTLGISSAARASDDAVDQRVPEIGSRWKLFNDLLDPEERYHRTQAVLSHLNVPAEPDSRPRLASYQGMQSLNALQALLPVFDFGSEFPKFAELQASRMSVFQDAQAMQVPDFDVTLKSAGDTTPDDDFVTHLKAARANPTNRPLQGLRIALDPGHMGGDWDEITGKWVEDTDGRKLSEGVINLQTAMLVEQRLMALGAQTMITRRGLRPVTDGDYQTFDVRAWGLQTLRQQSLESWFLSLLSTAPAGQALYDAFENSADLKRIFAESNRPVYYNDSDLYARNDAIEAFQPDITLIIHYDAAVHSITPPGNDATKVYVPGAFAPAELATRDARVQLAMHLLDEASWRASVAFAHEVVTTLSRNLKIPLDRTSPGNIREIEPGMFSRNLALLKRHRASATAYAECAFYNDRNEFDALSNAIHPMTIDGANHPYSDRLALVASSLSQAVVQFVQKGF